MKRAHIINGFAFSGLGLIAAGAFMLSIPAGLIAVGVTLLSAAIIAGVFF